MFFRRIIDHLLNQVLVEGLANSRTFQRFVVKADSVMKELKTKGAQGGSTMDGAFTKGTSTVKEYFEQAKKDFQQELTKMQQQQQQQVKK